MVFSSVHRGCVGRDDPNVGDSGPVSADVCTIGSTSLSNAGFHDARPMLPSM